MYIYLCAVGRGGVRVCIYWVRCVFGGGVGGGGGGVSVCMCMC